MGRHTVHPGREFDLEQSTSILGAAATAACSQGDRYACAQLPALNAQVQTENQNNQVATGVAAAAGGLIGGAAIGAAASGPGYYYGPHYYHGYRRCYGCW